MKKIKKYDAFINEKGWLDEETCIHYTQGSYAWRSHFFHSKKYSRFFIGKNDGNTINVVDAKEGTLLATFKASNKHYSISEFHIYNEWLIVKCNNLKFIMIHTESLSVLHPNVMLNHNKLRLMSSNFDILLFLSYDRTEWFKFDDGSCQFIMTSAKPLDENTVMFPFLSKENVLYIVETNENEIYSICNYNYETLEIKKPIFSHTSTTRVTHFFLGKNIIAFRVVSEDYTLFPYSFYDFTKNKFLCNIEFKAEPFYIYPEVEMCYIACDRNPRLVLYSAKSEALNKKREGKPKNDPLFLSVYCLNTGMMLDSASYYAELYTYDPITIIPLKNNKIAICYDNKLIIRDYILKEETMIANGIVGLYNEIPNTQSFRLYHGAINDALYFANHFNKGSLLSCKLK